MLEDLAEVRLFLVALAVFLAVLEVAFRLGCRQRDPSDEDARTHSRALEAALLGLLALLLGFNFAMAASRFDARKALIQEEVNAIGTTYLREQMLPASHRQEAAALLRSYVAARIEFMQAGTDPALLEAADEKASGIEAKLWTVATAAMAEDRGSAATRLFVESLNKVIDVREKRRVALGNRVPRVVIQLLFTVALGALGFLAYGYGLTGRRRHGSTGIFALLIALVFTTIVDLDRPRSGFIRVSEEGMFRLQAAMERDAPK